MNLLKSKTLVSGDQTKKEMPFQNNQQQFLTLQEVCSLFNIRPESVYKLVDNGLTEYRFSERLARYDINEVMSLTRNRKV
jgi:hypothetical protein